MKNMTMGQLLLLEKIAQEETGERRRSKIKSLAKNIRDWWNHCCDSTPAQREFEDRIREIKTKYASYRIL